MLEGVFPATVMPDADWWQALWPRPDAVVAGLGVADTAEAVDLCCGDGLFTVALARVARQVTAEAFAKAGASVILIDRDAETVGQAAEGLRAAGRNAIGVTCAVTGGAQVEAMIRRASAPMGGATRPAPMPG